MSTWLEYGEAIMESPRRHHGPNTARRSEEWKSTPRRSSAAERAGGEGSRHNGPLVADEASSLVLQPPVNVTALPISPGRGTVSSYACSSAASAPNSARLGCGNSNDALPLTLEREPTRSRSQVEKMDLRIVDQDNQIGDLKGRVQTLETLLQSLASGFDAPQPQLAQPHPGSKAPLAHLSAAREAFASAPPMPPSTFGVDESPSVLAAATAPGDVASVDAVVVAGSEKHQTSCMGLYVRTSNAPGGHNGARPIYQNANGRYLFYWAQTGGWRIGHDYNSHIGGLESQVHEQTWCPSRATGWKIFRDHTWHLEPNIRVTPRSQADAEATSSMASSELWLGDHTPETAYILTASESRDAASSMPVFKSSGSRQDAHSSTRASPSPDSSSIAALVNRQDSSTTLSRSPSFEALPVHELTQRERLAMGASMPLPPVATPPRRVAPQVVHAPPMPLRTASSSSTLPATTSNVLMGRLTTPTPPRAASTPLRATSSSSTLPVSTTTVLVGGVTTPPPPRPSEAASGGQGAPSMQRAGSSTVPRGGSSSVPMGASSSVPVMTPLGTKSWFYAGPARGTSLSRQNSTEVNSRSEHLANGGGSLHSAPVSILQPSSRAVSPSRGATPARVLSTGRARSVDQLQRWQASSQGPSRVPTAGAGLAGPARGTTMPTAPAPPVQSSLVHERVTLAPHPPTVVSPSRVLSAPSSGVVTGTLQAPESSKGLILPPPPASSSSQASTSSLHPPIVASTVGAARVTEPIVHPPVQVAVQVRIPEAFSRPAVGHVVEGPVITPRGKALSTAPEPLPKASAGESRGSSQSSVPTSTRVGDGSSNEDRLQHVQERSQAGPPRQGMSAFLAKQLTALPPAPSGPLGPGNRRPSDQADAVTVEASAPGTRSSGSSNGPLECIGVDSPKEVYEEEARLEASSTLLFEPVPNGLPQSELDKLSNEESSVGLMEDYKQSGTSAFLRGAGQSPRTSSEEVQALNDAYNRLLAETRGQPEQHGATLLQHGVTDVKGSKLAINKSLELGPAGYNLDSLSLPTKTPLEEFKTGRFSPTAPSMAKLSHGVTDVHGSSPVKSLGPAQAGSSLHSAFSSPTKTPTATSSTTHFSPPASSSSPTLPQMPQILSPTPRPTSASRASSGRTFGATASSLARQTAGRAAREAHERNSRGISPRKSSPSGAASRGGGMQRQLPSKAR